MAFNILSLDGGGIRGLFTVRLLERLAQARSGFLDRFDLFAGTSTGGILALGLAKQLTPTQIVSFYVNNAKRIFPDSLFREFDQTIEPKYSNKGLKEALVEILNADTKLEALHWEVFVTSYDCTKRTPVDFTRSDTPEELAVDVALRTSAAPVYFPPYQDRYIDGGMTANNPSSSVLAWARGKGHEDLRILSLGTGNADMPPLKLGNFGGIDWLKHGLIDLMFEGPSERSDLNCSRELRKNYFRLDGKVDCPMDANTELNDRLIKPADDLKLQAALDWFDREIGSAG